MSAAGATAHEVSMASVVDDPREELSLLLRDLRSSPEGLGEREAERRLLFHGRNVLSRRSGRRWPTNLLNFGEAVNFPLIFGLAVALFGVATLLHFLVVSVARRRREVGILKSIGFVRRQVALAVSWQATTIALIGIVIGVPLGIALGRAVWSAFATNLGVFPQLVVNTALIALIAGGALVVANLLAIGPALASARSPSASLLAVE
jgi:predicted lysophospholipase L1 biosynthesis ABC-type transport system permease subunit